LPGFYPWLARISLVTFIRGNFLYSFSLQKGCREVEKGELRIIKELTASFGVKNKIVTYFE